MPKSRFVTVYFTTRWRFSFGRVPLLLRACRRRPSMIGRAGRLLLIRALTGSDLTHVSVAVDRVVLCPAHHGDRFWGELAFRSLFPGIVEAVDVPVTRLPDLEAWVTQNKKSTIRCLARWASGGRIPGHDCVTVVSDVLRAAGIPVPPRVCSPHQLFLWLVKEGHAVGTH